MGRAIGFLLLCVGIGLAIYGVPTSDGTAPSLITNSISRSIHETAQGRSAGVDEEDRARAVDERARANGTISRTRAGLAEVKGAGEAGVARVGSSNVDQAAIAPMEKLRTAANIRAQAAAEETSGSVRPLSHSAQLGVAVPRPIEVTGHARQSPPVPSVIAEARRETANGLAAARARIGANASPGRGGWSTSVASTSTTSTPASGSTGAEPSRSSQGSAAVAEPRTTSPAPTKAAVVAVPWGSRYAATVTAPPATEVQGGIAGDASGNAAKTGLSANGAQAEGEAGFDRPPAKAPRTHLANRYGPPVYLGRQGSPAYTFTYVPTYASGNAAPRRKFRSQDLWERQRRDGM